MQNNKNKQCKSIPDGRSINIIAASAANLISRNMTDKEISLLALFFSTLSDSLETIVAANLLISDNADEVILGESII